ncbi:hypothetical protein IE980_27310 [Klebsiella pneumoniae]|uniref:Uncharacterized protein n=1 Tax=Klebsiella pneumoniae TaxID=573 RepID=A0A927E498_KLEPN|nr:hypothetical protein [Klebsiella pneumoniae]
MKPAMASVRTVVPCSRSLNTRSSRPSARRLAGLLLTHYRFPNVRRKIRGYPIPNYGTEARLYGNFFIYFAYTATIASRH